MSLIQLIMIFSGGIVAGLPTDEVAISSNFSLKFYYLLHQTVQNRNIKLLFYEPTIYSGHRLSQNLNFLYKHSGIMGSVINIPSSREIYVQKFDDSFRNLTFCYPGEMMNTLKLMVAVTLFVNVSTKDYLITWIENSTSIDAAIPFHENWFYSLCNIPKTFRLSPFSPVCFRIETFSKFNVEIRAALIDPIKLFYFCFALIIFLNSKRISRHTMLYYTFGVVWVIVMLHFILLVVLAASLKLKRFYLLLFFFTILEIWLYFCHNFTSSLLFKYLVIGAVPSFFVCYTKRIEWNIKMQKNIELILMFMSFVLIYNSNWYEGISTVFIIFLIEKKYHLISYFRKLGIQFYYHMSTPKCTLISVEEFYRQGQDQTYKELYELRQYILSFNDIAWELSLQLQPSSYERLTKFVLTEEHMSIKERFIHFITAEMSPEELKRARADPNDEARADPNDESSVNT